MLVYNRDTVSVKVQNINVSARPTFTIASYNSQLLWPKFTFMDTLLSLALPNEVYFYECFPNSFPLANQVYFYKCLLQSQTPVTEVHFYKKNPHQNHNNVNWSGKKCWLWNRIVGFHKLYITQTGKASLTSTSGHTHFQTCIPSAVCDLQEVSYSCTEVVIVQSQCIITHCTFLVLI